MTRIKTLYSSAIGKKSIAALTGLILFGFLIGHVAGNLKVFTGASSNGVYHIDEYGQFLKELGAPILPYMFGLWGSRLILLTSLIVHVVVVTQLALQSAEARPVAYVKSKKAAASIAARYMMVTGILIMGFVIFHILHLTAGIFDDKFIHGAVYQNLHGSFSNPFFACGYVLMMIVIGFHLFHGVWSLFQTLGLDNPDRNKSLRMFAIATTVLIVAGFIAVPLAFVLGGLPEPAGYPHELLMGH